MLRHLKLKIPSRDARAYRQDTRQCAVQVCRAHLRLAYYLKTETFLLSPSRRVPSRRHPPGPSETLSIQGQRGVDVFRPADDAAFERVQARRLEAELDERLARGGRANPRLMNSSLLLIRRRPSEPPPCSEVGSGEASFSTHTRVVWG